MWLDGLANRDFSPEFSRKVRRFVATPLGVLLMAAAVAALVGMTLHPRVFALTGGLLGVVVIGLAWPWITLRGLSPTVRFSRERVYEGEAVSTTLAVANQLPWPAWGLSLNGGFSTDSEQPAVRVGALSPRAKTVHRWEFIPELRGQYPITLPNLTSAFPFGIRDCNKPTKVEGKLLVWPKIFPVGPAPIAESDANVEGNVARNKVGSTGDVLGVRPYRRGDSPRRIHWVQSAKHDKLIVCELQSTARPLILLILDNDLAVHTSGKNGSWEWAVRVAGSFAHGWLTAGVPVGAVWRGTVIPPSSGGGQLLKIMDQLAQVSTEAGPPLNELLSSQAVRAAQSAVKLVITSDEGCRRCGSRHGEGYRWVVLDRHGFPDSTGEASQPRYTCDEAPPRKPLGAWLTFDEPASVPQLLRNGWAEARHGS